MRKEIKSQWPDPARCRARLIGYRDTVECLTVGSGDCKYAMKSCYTCFCSHKTRIEIARRTKAIRSKEEKEQNDSGSPQPSKR